MEAGVSPSIWKHEMMSSGFAFTALILSKIVESFSEFRCEVHRTFKPW
jgi:hypothetical protein